MAKYTNISARERGWNGKVYFADKNDGRIAVTHISFKDLSDGIPSSVIRYASLQKELEHENVARLLDVEFSGRDKSFLFEYEYLGTDLHDIFEDANQSVFENPQIIKKVLYQILCGIEYFHSQNLVLRDLKPVNLQIDLTKNIVKLVDLGFARPAGFPIEFEQIKAGYLRLAAPEVLLENHCECSSAVDVWSAGCLFARMVKNQYLFQGFSESEQLYTIFRVLGTPNEQTLPGVTLFHQHHFFYPHCEPKDLAAEVPSLEKDGVDLLSKMLRLNPRERITARDALQHKYFRDDGERKADR